MQRRVRLGIRELGRRPGGAGAAAGPGVVARKIVKPEITAEWSILWPARGQSATIARFLDSARRCADENNWLHSPRAVTGAEIDHRTSGRSE